MRYTLGFFGPAGRWEHDHSMVLMENGKILQMIQLERFTRRKYDNRLPEYFVQISKLFENQEYYLDDCDLIYANTFNEGEKFFNVSRNDFLSKDGKINFKHEGSRDITSLVETKGKIENKKYGASILSHELAHIYSCLPFYGDFKENSLLIHIDGAASLSNASAWIYQKGKIRLLEKTKAFHHTLLNFSYNDLTFEILNVQREKHFGMPGRLMGYACYGKCNEELYNWLNKNDFFRELNTNNNLERFKQGLKAFNSNVQTISQKEPLFFDIAACMQSHFEREISQFIYRNQEKTGAEYLYYSGGAALNIKLNSLLINSKKFKEVYIPPPTNDSGLSLGCAAYFESIIKKNNTHIHNPFLNNLLLDDYNFNPNFSIDDICREISEDKVIGISTGFAEAGPRALGHRSLIANPSSKKMGSYVSEIIKKREWYRPVAPIVLENLIDELFVDYLPNPTMYFMLYDFKVKEEMKDKIPAVVHVDGTSRAQIVKENDPNLSLIIEILKTMNEKYNIKCLINTSFNAAGEPIVHTMKDSLNSAKNMGLDGIILNNDYYKIR